MDAFSCCGVTVGFARSVWNQKECILSNETLSAAVISCRLGRVPCPTDSWKVWRALQAVSFIPFRVSGFWKAEEHPESLAPNLTPYCGVKADLFCHLEKKLYWSIIHIHFTLLKRLSQWFLVQESSVSVSANCTPFPSLHKEALWLSAHTLVLPSPPVPSSHHLLTILSDLKCKDVFLGSSSHLLICMSLLILVLHCLDYIVRCDVGSVNPPTLFSFEIVLALLGRLHFHMNFRNGLSISAHSQLGFWKGLQWTYRSFRGAFLPDIQSLIHEHGILPFLSRSYQSSFSGFVVFRNEILLFFFWLNLLLNILFYAIISGILLHFISRSFIVNV